MSSWSNRLAAWGLLTLLAGGLPAAAGAPAAPAAPSSIDEVQEALAHWDLARVEKLLPAVRREGASPEVLSYLDGVFWFYKGNYQKSRDAFGKVGDLKQFESSGEGFDALAKEILSTGLKFKIISNPETEVHVQAGPDEVMVPIIQSVIATIRHEINSALGVNAPEPLTIEIYPDADTFIAASPLSESEVKTSGTIALCKYGRILLTSPRSLLRGYPWVETLSHEYVHYALSRRWGATIPVWLHEGLAKYLEGRWRKGSAENYPSYLSPSFENSLAQALEKDQFVTFEQMHPSFAKLPSAETAQLAYAQVASFIGFLSEKPGGFARVQEVLDQMQKGLAYGDAFQKIYAAPIPALLNDWKKWLRAKKLKVVRGLDPRTLAFVGGKGAKAPAEDERSIDQKELGQIKSTSVREHLHLGDLLRYRNRLEASLVEYTRARDKMDGFSPVISTKLAMVNLSLKNLPEAEKILRETLETYPDEGLAYRLLGDTYFAQKNWEKAKEAYQHSLYINPFNPLVYKALMQAGRNAGEDKESAEWRKAAELLK